MFEAKYRTEFLLDGMKDRKAVETAKLSTAAFLEHWPTIPNVWIPDVLRLVNERGELQTNPKPKSKAKKA